MLALTVEWTTLIHSSLTFLIRPSDICNSFKMLLLEYWQTPRRDITLILRSRHWLSVRYKIEFKAVLIVYMSLNGLGSKYLRDMFAAWKVSQICREWFVSGAQSSDQTVKCRLAIMLPEPVLGQKSVFLKASQSSSSVPLFSSNRFYCMKLK